MSAGWCGGCGWSLPWSSSSSSSPAWPAFVFPAAASIIVALASSVVSPTFFVAAALGEEDIQLLGLDNEDYVHFID